jgi:choline dehydrogenase
LVAPSTVADLFCPRHGRHGAGIFHFPSELKAEPMSHSCHKNREYDYIIVGAGTAGSPLAYSLSQDGKTSVLVLEGGDDRRDDALINSGSQEDTDQTVEIHWHYPVQYGSFPNNVLDGAFKIYTEGRMWGGSSGHNYLLAVRGTPDIYNQWAVITNENRWQYNRLLPVM